MNISFRYRNKFLCQNEPILNFPQEDPSSDPGVLGQGGQDGQGQGEPDHDTVQPLQKTPLTGGGTGKSPNYLWII